MTAELRQSLVKPRTVLTRRRRLNRRGTPKEEDHHAGKPELAPRVVTLQLGIPDVSS